MTDENPNTSNAPTTTDLPAVAAGRRGFVRVAAALMSTLLGIVPLGIMARFMLNPILRKPSAGGDTGPTDSKDADGFVRLAVTTDALPEDGTPVAVKVKDNKTDAWNHFRDIEVGTVWLRRGSGGEILAFSSVCPHLGCAVDYRSAQSDFFCPCHTSSFDLKGDRTNLIPPRGMDQLKTRVKPETGNQIWLKYENFRAGTPEKIVTS